MTAADMHRDLADVYEKHGRTILAADHRAVASSLDRLAELSEPSEPSP